MVLRHNPEQFAPLPSSEGAKKRKDNSQEVKFASHEKVVDFEALGAKIENNKSGLFFSLAQIGLVKARLLCMGWEEK